MIMMFATFTPPRSRTSAADAGPQTGEKASMAACLAVGVYHGLESAAVCVDSGSVTAASTRRKRSTALSSVCIQTVLEGPSKPSSLAEAT